MERKAQVRKIASGKMNPVQIEFYAEKAKRFVMIRGKRILLMDDVISTGGSIHAMEELVKLAGGIVAGRVSVLAEGDAAARKDIKFLAPLPVFNADGSVK